ncbi:MAG: hypothetical protein U0231_17090 [Nitrospiraceae bacterium]
MAGRRALVGLCRFPAATDSFRSAAARAAGVATQALRAEGDRWLLRGELARAEESFQAARRTAESLDDEAV